jgi:hypothetical protein
MITDKHSQTLIFWCQKSLSPTSNSDTSSVLQHWAVWFIINKFIKQQWTLQECFPKYPKWSPLDPGAQRNFANVKSPFYKSTILKVLKKSVTSFPRLSFGRDTTCLTKPRQRTIRKISLLIEYGRARFITHIVTRHTWPSHKRSNPHP